MPKTKTTEVPYLFDGSLAHYEHRGWSDGKVVQWRPNEPFHATLQIQGIRTGRSAKYLVLKAPETALDDREFPMFVADFVNLAIDEGIPAGGIISGRWMVRKRGKNYGLRLATTEDDA